MSKQYKPNKRMLKELQQNYKFMDSDLLNNFTFQDFLHRFERIALSMFEWVNLPESMSERWLERTLYFHGKASVLDTEKYGIINASVASGSELNIYGLPTKLQCFSHLFYENRLLYSGLNESIDNQRMKEAVLVLNDEMSLPTCGTMEMYAQRLAEIQRTMDVNLAGQKFPVAIVGSKEQQLSLENLYNQYNGNQPFIFGDKKFLDPENSLKVINTQSPYVIDKLTDYKKEIINEALTFLGVNNVSIEKKERLVTDEANSNNEVINLNLQSRLAPRLRACKEMNDLFGLTGTDKEISVRVRSDLYNIIKKEMSVVSDYKPVENYETLESGEEDE